MSSDAHWPSLRGRDRRVDLTGEAGLVIDLLNGHDQWRERLVQTFSFEGGGEVRLISGYQVRFPGELLATYCKPWHDVARMVVPLGTRDKSVLLNVAFSGPGHSPAQLLPKAALAYHETNFLLTLLAATPNEERLSEGLPRDLVGAICRFSPHRYREARRKLNPRFGPRRDIEALAGYIADGIGLYPQPEVDVVRRWLRLLEPAKRTLAEALGEADTDESSSENILLALPELDRPPSSQREIEELLGRFVEAIGSASAAADRVFLGALSEYGRRYEIMVEVDVPIRQSFTLRMEEDRPLNLRMGRSRQVFAAGDARSAHLEARAVDHSVVFVGAPRTTYDQDVPADGFMDGLRATPETVSLYSSDGNRPFYIDVAFKLRLSAASLFVTALLAVLNVSGIVGAFVAPRDSLYVERLGLLLVPSTLAAALILTRDQTALAARLQRVPKTVVGATLIALWVVVLIQLIGFHDPSSALRDGLR